MQRLLILFLLLCSLVAGLAAPAGATNRQLVTIGTGGIGGVYFPAGLAICRLVNKGRDQHNLLCTANSSGGSLSNLQAIEAGDLEMGIVQSDWHHWMTAQQAGQLERSSRFANVRSAFSLYAEPFSLVVREDSGIEQLTDLVGKRVNIGSPGSGQRQTMEVLMAALDWEQETFSQVTELDSAEQAEALCKDQFDAMVFTVGHPNQSILEAASSCNAKLVNVAGPQIEQLLAEKVYYSPASIAGGTYHGNEQAIQTFAVTATFVVSAELPDETVYQVVKAVFENLPELRRQHPALAQLNRQSMAKPGLPVALHPGAVRYFREQGM